MKNRIYALLIVIFVFICNITPSFATNDVLPYITVEYTGTEQEVDSILLAKDINVTLHYLDTNGNIATSQVGSLYYTISNNAKINHVGVNEFLVTLNDLNYAHYVGLNNTFTVMGIEKTDNSDVQISIQPNINNTSQTSNDSNTNQDTFNLENNNTENIETEEPVKLSYAETDSTYTIKIPKTISIDAQTKSANYTIVCTSYSENLDYISVTPSLSFEMYQPNKDTIKATIEQNYTTFKNIEDASTLKDKEVLINNKINGTINVPDLSAGYWIGEFYFVINSAEKPYTEFTLNSSNISMPNIAVENGTVEIPEYFEYDGERYKIVEIAENAFEYRYDINNVVVPDSVVKIGQYAFNNCTTLKSITLPSNITIEENAFQYCTALEEINLEKITNIEKNAFIGCTNIKSITIAKQTTIGENAFQYCTAIEEIIFEGIADIKDGAFYGCTSLKEVSLPEGLTVVNKAVFYNCSNLEKVTLPSTLESINEEAFKYCSSLKTINLPSELKTLKSECFHNCSVLELTIPNSVTTIERNAFAYMPKIYYNGTATYEEDNLYWGAFNMN